LKILGISVLPAKKKITTEDIKASNHIYDAEKCDRTFEQATWQRQRDFGVKNLRVSKPGSPERGEIYNNRNRLIR
jgi:hypothetical protein